MFKFAKKTAIEKLLQDFPWLWAIKNDYALSSDKGIVVSQDVSDLKQVLTQTSSKTKYLVWVVVSEGIHEFNMSVRQLDASDEKKWFEAVMGKVCNFHNILYIVIADRDSVKEYADARIVIFRNPEKTALNRIVEQVCQLHGSNTHWLIPGDMN